jgi:hypothetical protein
MEHQEETLMGWQILPSERGFRLWSCHRQVDVVTDVPWQVAFRLKASLEANVPKRENSLNGGW